MNGIQKGAIAVGCGIVAVMGIVPPWVMVIPPFKMADVEYPGRYKHLGYAPIYAPPERRDFTPWIPVSKRVPEPGETPTDTIFRDLEARPLAELAEGMQVRSAALDLPRLSVQWVVVAALTVGATVLGATRKS